MLYLEEDAHHAEFKRSARERNSICRTLTASIIKSLGIMPHSDVDAILDHGRMCLFSYTQLECMLHNAGVSSLPMQGHLLDIGAGAGHITQVLARAVQGQVFANDKSQYMTRALRNKGFNVEEDINNKKFALVSILNVLDRCERPLTLIRQAKQLLAPDGIMIIAVVHPFRPWVEKGSRIFFGTKWNRPEQDENLSYLFKHCKSWQDHARILSEKVFLPEGLQTMSVSRMPYLSESQNIFSDNDVVSLDDAVFVLKKFNR
jgi:SAM-dependent methyltransferase